MSQHDEERLLEAVTELAREERVQLMSQELGGEAYAELSEAELEALAASVTAQLAGETPGAATPPPLQRWRGRSTAAARLLAVLAAAAALFGGGLWLARQELSEPSPGAERAALPSSSRQLALPDGSTLALAEQTLARVVKLEPGEVRVQLERGSVECEVAPDPARRFVVATGAFEVVVKGTRFTVSSGLESTAPEQVVVSVERGLVEVRQPPDRVLAALGAGQRWSSDGRSLPTASVEPPAAATPAAAAPAAPPPSAVPPAPRQPAREAAPRPVSSARSLFERADAERLAGRAREAAAAFDELRRSHPNDSRAGYAAFMLGRIRLDSLGDPAGAAEAFEFAIAHPGSGFFLEDAQARRVEALARWGRQRECQQAREQFLARYPQAVRAPAVRQLCP